MNSEAKGKKVFVGLSGGVDSAVSAALLKEQGYEVVGVFMKNWSGDDFGIQSDCPWEVDQKDAMAVAARLGIEFRSLNFEKEYRDKVVEYFFAEYKKGRTPNPDVMCNKEIKFKLFLEKALEQDADFIATGHYARHSIENTNQHKLLKGIDSNKDQTYFLYNLTQSQLSRTLFPIGDLHKPQVRELARKFGLPNAEKPDSQGICFIGEIDVLKFLMSRLLENPGEIRDIDTNRVVGEHKGIYFYTVGQREGLGIGGLKVPHFVTGKDKEKNILYVAAGPDHPSLYKKEVQLENLHLIGYETIESIVGINLEASVRYRHKPKVGKLIINKRELGDEINDESGNIASHLSRFTFLFDEPQRAITSGQSLVIYNGDECIGGGVIK